MLAGALFCRELLCPQHANLAVHLDFNAEAILETARHLGHLINRRAVAYRDASLALCSIDQLRCDIDCLNVRHSCRVHTSSADARADCKCGRSEQEITATDAID